MTVATNFLARLLKQVERAESKNRSSIRLPLSRAKCPAYYGMRSLQDAESFRGELQAAANAGAIRLELLRGHAWPRDVGAILLEDLDLLGKHLGMRLLRDRMAMARRLLEPHVAQHPVVGRVLESWAAGKTVRRCGPDRTDSVLDAIRVVNDRRGATEDVLIRRASIRLFGKSKRIEALAPWIALISLNDLSPSGLTRREVLASQGLLREPQSFLISGAGHVQIDGTAVPLVRPYLELPVLEIVSFGLAEVEAPQFLLTIENKETFHALARAPGVRRGILVYTGGMPSPAWVRAYRLLLAAVPPQTPCLHYGDMDLGGFRIAGRLAQLVAAHGRALRPWRMDPGAYLARGLALTSVTEARANAIRRAAEEAGWPDIADQLIDSPGQGEQEALPLDLP